MEEIMDAPEMDSTAGDSAVEEVSDTMSFVTPEAEAHAVEA